MRIQATRHLDDLRRALAEGSLGEEDLVRRIASLPDDLARAVGETEGRGLRRVINATGIFVHTNLGRAPLPAETTEALAALLSGYCDLEMDLEHGERSDRNRFVARRLREICRAEDAVVVNNNAAALFLILHTLASGREASGREVVVSRGELVEIGGSFRIPDIMESAGARLVEVGTTNRTRIDDYRRAIGEDTALLLKVHTSNYRIRGFTEAPAVEELVALGRELGLPVVVDEGCGLLRRSERAPLRDHDALAPLLAAGCDVVCGSGDKILGGPQAGLILGRRELVRRCRKSPLYRVLRPGGFTFAALDLVLRRHQAGAPLPMDRLWPDEEDYEARLRAGREALGAEVVAADAYLGGGSAPDRPVPGKALALAGDDELLARLRTGGANGDPPPVVGYLREGRLVLDLRTVGPADDEDLFCAVRAARKA